MTETAHPFAATSISAFYGGFRTLDGLIDKAEQFVASGKATEAGLLEGRLVDDMDPFRRQIQHACDAAKACVMRLAGRSVQRIEDSEASLEELRQRIATTRSLLALVSHDDLVGSESRTIKVNLRRRWITFDGQSYLLEFALPNVYFHVTTAYAILRHMGVTIGKLDFLTDVARRREALTAQKVDQAA